MLVVRVAIVAKKGRYHCFLGMGCKLRVLLDVMVVVYPTQATQPTARLTRQGFDLKRNIPAINFYFLGTSVQTQVTRGLFSDLAFQIEERLHIIHYDSLSLKELPVITSATATKERRACG